MDEAALREILASNAAYWRGEPSGERACLAGADLRMADLRKACLRQADLREADLRGALLIGADLTGADVTGVIWDETTRGIEAAAEGELIGWGKKLGHLVKMRIEADTPRSRATGNKHRAARVTVLEIDDGELMEFEHTPRYASTIPSTRYAVGAVTEADSWDDNRWNECSHGIHFFLTREEAEAYDG